MKAVAKRFEGNGFDDFGDERSLEQKAGFLLVDASLTHVEEGRFVHLADGAAVAALHIVSINLEHWLRIHAGRTRGTQVGIRFFARRLLSTLANQHLSGKGSDCTIVEDVLIQLARLTSGNLVVDECVVVHALHLVGNDTAVGRHLASFALQKDIEPVASYR